jgi:membrane protease YdiL (CAAX protease family)
MVVGCAAGVFGALLWVALLLPFQDARAGEPFALAAFLLRLTAATLVVPFAEELLCRGYILGVITQWQEARRSGKNALDVVLDERSVRELPPGACTWLAALVSSAAFALGHGSAQWLAAFGYGLLMAGLWRLRRDLITRDHCARDHEPGALHLTFSKRAIGGCGKASALILLVS